MSGLHEKAMERFKLAQDAWSDNFDKWLEDARFRNGDQWPEKVKEYRTKAGRPMMVVDKLNQYVRQVVNDGRMNRPAVKVRPIGDGGDVKVAEAFQGIIRHICDRSNADEAFDTALDCAVTGGFGFFRVATEYASEGTFNQDICVKRIRNPLTVLLDPNFKNADGSDASYAFVVEEMPKDEFKARYPNAEFADWVTDTKKYADEWLSDDTVRVVEYFRKEAVKKTLHLLADGTTADDETLQAALAAGILAPPIVETRELDSHKIKWCRLSGAEVLEENDWLGKYIPIVPEFGNESDIDGKVIYSGLIRNAKDAQSLYNYARTAYAERVALTPKAPFIAAVGQVEDFEEWESANTENHSVLRYSPIDVSGTALPPPQRQSPSDIPEGFARDMQLSEHDIQGSMGMYNASLGEKSNEKSGRAIMARQREGDTATFHYQDNQTRAIRYLGRILIDLIPKVYDSKRAIRILGEDGEAEMAEIDPNQPEATRKEGDKTIYNLNVGEFDVSVSAGPSYTTKRQEAVEIQMQLFQANPQLFQLIGDITVKNMDMPGAEEISKRLKAMLPPEIKQLEDDSESPEVQQVKMQAQQMLDQASQQIQAAEQGIAERDQAMKEQADEINALKLDAKNRRDENEIKSNETLVRAFDAGTKRMQVLAPAIAPDQVAQIVQKTVSEIMATPSPATQEIEPLIPITDTMQGPADADIFAPEGM